tara:strand:+ start:35652 stop:35759 length:108 start_codon:yes stop_codon:yes gene_type:complete
MAALNYYKAIILFALLRRISLNMEIVLFRWTRNSF